MRALPLSIALLACAACSEPQQAQTAAAPAGVVDSIFPIEEEVRRFKLQLPGSAPAELSNTSESREALVERFIAALERSDTAEIGALAVTSWEFIELYYPYTQYTRPPYKQSPRLLWFLIQQNSQKGIGRVLTRYGGKPSGYRGIDCRDSAKIQGPNRIWERCQVRWTGGEQKPDPMILFGSILERNGRFKFISYANDL